MDQPAWQRRLEPYVAVFFGVIMVASGLLIVDSGLETNGTHVWEPLDFLNALSGRSVQIAGWGELALGTAFHIYGIALIWIAIRRLARSRAHSTE